MDTVPSESFLESVFSFMEMQMWKGNVYHVKPSHHEHGFYWYNITNKGFHKKCDEWLLIRTSKGCIGVGEKTSFCEIFFFP